MSSQDGLEEWVKYAKNWVEKYAPEEAKFDVKKELPKETKNLSKEQKELLKKIANELGKELTGEEFQTKIYDLGKELGLSGKETFAAVYLCLLGKDHGPKAAWLILSLDKNFVSKRFRQASI